MSKSRCNIDKQSMFWDSKKSIERRRIVSVRKSKTGFADAYVKFSLGGFDGGKGKYY